MIRSLRQALRWLGPHERAVRRIRAERPGQLLQPEATTGEGRYPWLFDFLAAELGTLDQPRVLSLGCSTGEELLALRKALPRAQILGADINPRSLRKARQRAAGDPGIALQLAGDPAEIAGAPFDAVLCLAVVRHARLQAEAPASCAGVLPFARAEAFVEGLAALTRPGGLLALWNVHFRLSDMVCAADFEPALDMAKGAAANQPLYGRGDRRLDGETCTTAVWRRRQPRRQA